MTRRRKQSPVEINLEDFLLEYENVESVKQEVTCKQRLCRCCLITGTITVVLALLVFLLIFVMVPVIFMYSSGFQTNLIFIKYLNNEDFEFTNFRKYGMEGTRNLYVNINTAGEPITLGVWHILPLALVNDAVEDNDFNYVEALHQSTHPVLIYFHGTTGNRIKFTNQYRVFRRFFHVIVFDYRSYGDSTEGDLSEESIVVDCVQMYKWVRSQTKADIFVWGHSLGASLSVHTVKRLRTDGLVPTGLFLEAPFTTLREEMYYFPGTKIFSWLPWFEATFLNPLEKNGFHFKTTDYILSVDCPILIMHAEDDSIIPYFMSEKLVGIAREMRDQNIQGNVTFRLLAAQFGFGHFDTYQALELPDYIKSHINVCRTHQNSKS